MGLRPLGARASRPLRMRARCPRSQDVGLREPSRARKQAVFPCQQPLPDGRGSSRSAKLTDIPLSGQAFDSLNAERNIVPAVYNTTNTTSQRT